MVDFFFGNSGHFFLDPLPEGADVVIPCGQLLVCGFEVFFYDFGVVFDGCIDVVEFVGEFFLF